MGGFAAGRVTTQDDGGAAGTGSYAFRGQHQAGIVTPAQGRLHFAAFDVTTDDRDELVALLQDWTDAAARMTQGDPAGEAIGLPPSGLTITFGFGPSLVRDDDGTDRFELADRQPAALFAVPPGTEPGEHVGPSLFA